MIKSLKKNQIIIFAVALMLIAAGYLNYSMTAEKTTQVWSNATEEEIAGIGDAKLVSSNNIIEDTTKEEVSENNKDYNSKNTQIDKEDDEEDDDDDIETSAQVSSNNYFSESRLERDKMFSEMLESYQSILSNNSISSEQRNSAQNEISKINSQKNAIMISENLIKNKGFKDIVIFVNNESVSVVIDSEKLEEADIAQIQNIIQRELNVNVENIHISNKI